MTSKGPKTEQRGGGGGGKSQARHHTGSSGTGQQQVHAPTTWEKLPMLNTRFTSGQVEQWKRDAVNLLAREFGELALALESGKLPTAQLPRHAAFVRDYVQNGMNAILEESDKRWTPSVKTV